MANHLVVCRGPKKYPATDDQSWRRTSSFYAPCKLKGHTFRVNISNEWSYNVVSPLMAESLIQSPKVGSWCSVPFWIGEYQDEVWCCVQPLDRCDLLLGRPWQFDKQVLYNAFQNSYTFFHKGRKMLLVSLQHQEVDDIYMGHKKNRDDVAITVVDHRNNIFCIGCESHGEIFDLRIGDNVNSNIVSAKMVERLKLSMFEHPSPYRTNNPCECHVTKQCLVSFSINRYKDEVLCDVVPMDKCDLILGKPWQFDRQVLYNGFENTYEFEHKGQTIQLLPWNPPKKASRPSFCERLLENMSQNCEILLEVMKRIPSPSSICNRLLKFVRQIPFPPWVFRRTTAFIFVMILNVLMILLFIMFTKVV